MMPVTVVYDAESSDRATAVSGFYRMLEQAEQAGLLETVPAHISYGEARDAVDFAPQWEGYLPKPGDDDCAADGADARPAPEPLPWHSADGRFAALVEELTRTAQSCGVRPQDLDSLVHDAVSRDASAINDQGLEAQIARLVQAWGTGARAAVDGVILAINDDDPNES